MGLILLLSLLLSYSPIVSYAQEMDDSWPTEKIDYPPGVYQDPTGEKAEEILRTWPKQSEIDQQKREKKAKGGFLGKLNPFKPKEAPPLTDEQVTNVGPRETRPLTDPLLPLPVPLALTETVHGRGSNGADSWGGESRARKQIDPGFYVVWQEVVSGDQRNVTLVRQNQPVYTVPVYKVAGDNAPENSPLEPVEKTAPTINRVTMDSKVSTDGKNLVIYLLDGQERYQSNPLPTLVDTRREMRY